MIYRYHKSGDGQQLSEQTRKAFTRKNIHELSSKNETFVALVVTLGGTVNYVSEILGTHKGSTCNIEKPHLVFLANKLSVKCVCIYAELGRYQVDVVAERNIGVMLHSQFFLKMSNLSV